ncbi:MAG: hypothetical protein U5K84_02600 [Alkalibacterium sp.]|nr:hypothetical protein [Alkalibacterium sp.]
MAGQMAPASLAGFADMYLPALFISGATSEAARFFIGVLAFTQLVFMSETGMILVETKIGLEFLGRHQQGSCSETIIPIPAVSDHHQYTRCDECYFILKL